MSQGDAFAPPAVAGAGAERRVRLASCDPPLLQPPAMFAARARAPLATRIGLALTSPSEHDPARDRIEGLIDKLRDARVGGPFWGDRPPLPAGCTIIKAKEASRASRYPSGTGPIFFCAEDPEDVASATDGPQMLRGELDPWHVLDHATHIIAPLNDPLAVLAALIGIPVTDAGNGEKSSLNSADRAALAWKALVAGIEYRDPFTGLASTAEATIDLLGEWRRHLDATAGIGVQLGMHAWKRPQIDRFLARPSGVPSHARTARDAIEVAQRANAAIAIWPSRVPPQFTAEASAVGVEVVRVEDGFLRSFGLGVHLVPPQSIVIDRRGIYYDPAQPSDLEHLLANQSFTPALLRRAAALRQRIVETGLGKYGRNHSAPAILCPSSRRRVLVIGQVADDQSVLLGDTGKRGNVGLLERARARAPDAFLIYKPHPDVLSGHRRGSLDPAARRLADHVIDTPCGLAPLLDGVDEVHVLTSLAGFEALLRGSRVVCHGMPFYAGWGLTDDLVTLPRRSRRLSVDELVAGTLLLYPLYLDPESGLPCAAERLVTWLATATPKRSWLSCARRLQGAVRAAWERRAA